MEPAPAQEMATLPYVLQEFDQCVDLLHRTFPGIEADLVYFDSIIDSKLLASEILEPFTNVRPHEVKELLRQAPVVLVTDAKKVVEGIVNGGVAIFHDGSTYLLHLYSPESRTVQQSETETVITGPHDSFVESLTTNLSLIRRRIKSSHLKIIPCSVGEISKSKVYILYIQNIANPEHVEEMRKRVQRIETDGILDGSILTQYLEDSPNSVFPQFMITERPDVAASKLMSGRVLTIMENSPIVVSAPAAFFEFFASPDDYYQRWALGTALRMLRFMALLITVTFTAMYVSVTTFHYEMVPEALLRTLAESRSRVPFPPVYEALLLETMIELLREAGARLPTKIGQTIGIVGGIVIGQAAVQAGLTSNILIIAVATSAIASFVIPSYMMSASIRLIRFGLIILAGTWGNMGLVMGIALIIIHLSGLTSLKASYMIPLAPMKPSDWKDVFIRAPFSMLTKRPTQVKTPNSTRQTDNEQE